MTLDDILVKLRDKHQQLIAQIPPVPERFIALEGEYNHWLNKFPAHPALLFGLGTLSTQLDRNGLAIALLKEALNNGAVGPAPWLNLALAHKNEHNDDKAAECYRKALAEAENDTSVEEKAIALNGLATLYINAGDPRTCIYWADKALAVNPDDNSAKWNRGLAHLEAGEFAEGFRAYDEAGFATGAWKAPDRKIKTYGGLPRWDGTPGQTVICYGEQGVGDEVMFASILPDLLRDCKVIIDCDARLEALFRRAFPQAVAIYTTSAVDAPSPWLENHKADAVVAMGSLGNFYRHNREMFPKKPFLEADPALLAKWGDILKPYTGLKIGISWRGGLKKTREDMRSIPLAEWGDILKTPGCEFFSLQYHDDAADEAAAVGTQYGVPIHHWKDVAGREGWDDKAAMLASMDLVITVNTSLHHLAGALGVRQWCLTPVYCAWRYGVAGPSPWYGNCEMLRQKRKNEWRPVLDNVKTRLIVMSKVRQVLAA